MVKIRLKLAGRKKRKFFHIIVIDSRRHRDAGDVLEKIGYYDPLKKVENALEKFTINKDRLNHWLGLGAQPTDKILYYINNNK